MTVNHLIQKEEFIQWVLAPTRESDNYWKKWLQENPDQQEVVLEARAWILKIHSSEIEADSQDKNAREEVWRSISANIQHHPIPALKRQRFARLALIATLLVTIITAVYYFVGIDKTQNSIVNNAALATVMPANLLDESYAMKRVNQSDTGRIVYLTDGTKVILDPGSFISNNVLFRDEKREVHLTGSAFFEVARDTTRPFFVYTDDVVVSVLGTSFKIISDQKKEKLTVAVHNGKVSVLSTDKDKKIISHILQRNELIEVNKKNSVAAKSIVKDSMMLTPPPMAKVNFTFEDAPVEDVFKQLESVYNIEIIYNKQKLSKCRLTTSLDAESFYNKLSIVCLALHTDYQVMNGKIQISGEGCN